MDQVSQEKKTRNNRILIAFIVILIISLLSLTASIYWTKYDKTLGFGVISWISVSSIITILSIVLIVLSVQNKL
jgi:hypothetical protein